ncbi:MAG: cytochrome c biogenesis protein CcdA [Janthinobacterium lividum]
MKYFKFFGLVWIALLLNDLASAQILTPTHLSTALSQQKAVVGTEIELIVNARIQDKWHLYATDFSEDVGPTVFTLKFQPSPAYELVGKATSVKSHHIEDPVFKGEVAYWENTGQIRQRIKVLQPGALTIKADADYQSCTDVDGRCVPGSDALTFGSLAVTGAAGATPGASTPPAATQAVAPVAVVTPTAVTPATTSEAPTPTPTAAAAGASLPTPPAALTASEATAATAATPVAIAAPAADAGGLWSFGLLAFLSGLAALLTPCVFPMVPMTVSYFTGGQDSRSRGILKALVYGLSIVLIYTLIGVVVARLLGEEGPNFMATHWLPNLVFFVVFVTFGLSFLGLFEINLPNSLVNKADTQADKGGWLGVFFMAFTLVLVSFSCTGPIVATILGLAARGQTITPVVGMVGFSLAFALPFTLFAIFPSMLKSLPRSGGWLNTVKVVLGFVELMLALKFLSMVDLAYHWGILTRDVYLVLWIVLSALLGLYLLGKYRLSHDSTLDHLSVGRLLMAVLAFSFMTYLIPGLFGAPLPLLAGYLPPQSNHDFSIASGNGEGSAALARTNLPTQCETPHYAEFLELPHGLAGYFDLEQAKRCARAQHKPIFIDFTGHACVNCRKMEASVWSDPQILKRLREDYVVVALYVDDKAELPTAEQYVSPRDKQLKTTLGKRNADLQITRYGFNAQPYYVLLDPNDPADKPLTTPVAYEPNVAQFSSFLDRGVSQFHQKQGVAKR